MIEGIEATIAKKGKEFGGQLVMSFTKSMGDMVANLPIVACTEITWTLHELGIIEAKNIVARLTADDREYERFLEASMSNWQTGSEVCAARAHNAIAIALKEVGQEALQFAVELGVNVATSSLAAMAERVK